MNDFSFKLLFGSIETREYVVKILENILNIKIDPSKIEFLNTELITSTFSDEKGKITDCYILYDKKYHLIFECNKTKSDDLYKLKARYIFFAYNNSYKIGEINKNRDEEVFILVNINDFANESGKNIEVHHLKSTDKNILIKDLKIINISLESIEKAWYNKTTLSKLEKLMLFLKIGNTNKAEELLKEEKELMSIREQLEKMSMQDAFQAFFDKDEEDARELESIKKSERKSGVEEGKVLGRVLGRDEREAEMVIAMHAKEMSLKDIAEIANLNERQVEKIINQYSKSSITA